MVAPLDGAVALWLLDENANAWATGPDLGITPSAQMQVGTEVLGGFVLVTSEQVVDRGDGIGVQGEQQGALISPSLDVIPMASTPDGLFMTFTRPYGADWDFSTVGLLDLATGTWTTHRLADPPPTDAVVVWEANTNGSVALLRFRDTQGNSLDDKPDLSYDATSGSWRTPTPDDIALWHSLDTVDTVDIRTPRILRPPTLTRIRRQSASGVTSESSALQAPNSAARPHEKGTARCTRRSSTTSTIRSRRSR